MATIYVNINASGNNNGTNWIDAYQSLEQAITTSISGDQIWIAQGVYVSSIEVGGTGSSFMSFTLKSGVKIYGGFVGSEVNLGQRILSSLNETVLDGTGKYHTINVTNTALNNQTILDGVTIKNGNANSTGVHSAGGGMLFSSSSAGSSVFATISNCILEDNISTNEGGGIYASRYCNLTLLNCVFNNNVADRRGGGYFGVRNNCQIYGCTFYLNRTTITSDTNAGGGAIFISTSVNTEFTNIAGCTFQSNASASIGVSDTGKGGAIGSSINPGKLVIFNCQFEDNSAQFGGALALRSGGASGRDSSYIIVKQCNFRLNNSTYGGGIFIDNHNAFFINCTIVGNQATQQSGGFYVRFGGPRMFSCLISGNKAGNYGGGVYFTNSLTGASRPKLNNTTISGNYSERGGSIALINNSECELNNCIIFDNNGELDGKSMHIATGCSILADYSIYQNNDGDIHLEGTGSFSPLNSSSNNPLFINGILGSSANTPNILGDYRIRDISQCMDSGLNSYCPCRNDAFGGLRNRSIQKEPLKNLIILGASLMESAFGRDLSGINSTATTELRSETGINDLNVYGYGWSGYNISALLPKIDEALAAFPNNDTLFFIHIGGNNVTSTRPYSGMTPEQLSSFRSDLDLLFAKANSTNGRMIINDLTFRSYSDPLDLNSDSMFLNDINGSRPYIDNEYKPRQLLNQPEFLNSDNNSAVDVYNMVRNHWTALLRNDGIHFNISSYGALRKFIINRVAYLFNNTLKPTVVGPEPTREKIIVEIGNANRDNYNSVGYEYWPNNFLQFTTANIGSKPISRNTKTITGQDRGIMYLDTTATVIGTSGTDVVSGSNTIKPTTSYKDWEVRSFEIMGRSQYFNASHTITLRFEGLTPNKQYNVEFVGSRVAGDTRITRLTCLQNSNFGEINTSNSVPELGALVGVTDSSGIMTFVASCVLGTYGYLAGVSIEPIP